MNDRTCPCDAEGQSLSCTNQISLATTWFSREESRDGQVHLRRIIIKRFMRGLLISSEIEKQIGRKKNQTTFGSPNESEFYALAITNKPVKKLNATNFIKREAERK